MPVFVTRSLLSRFGDLLMLAVDGPLEIRASLIPASLSTSVETQNAIDVYVKFDASSLSRGSRLSSQKSVQF